MGCRRVADPSELMRVVAADGGGLAEGRSLPGRGAWLCADSLPCVEAADRRRAFSRALRTEVRPDAVAALQSSVADRARIEGSVASAAVRADGRRSSFDVTVGKRVPEEDEGK